VGVNNTEQQAITQLLGVCRFRAHVTFRTRALLNSDPFLDRTLLYQQDGKHYKLKLSDEELDAVLNSRKPGTVVTKKPQMSESQLS
jgi:hypothetical protein